VIARGQQRASIFDFCYFLAPQKPKIAPLHDKEVFRLLFVGNLIKRKRVHLILETLAEMPAHVVLDVVGDGPLRVELEVFADAHLPGRVTFHGARPMPEIPSFMRDADCLVLPSDHDGWGAVVSESMIVGTPVVCSDRCGASVVVRASGRGHVFETFTPRACTEALMAQVAAGASDDAERAALADWATCLTEEAGAAYLDAIITHLRHGHPRPAPPWNSGSSLRNKRKITQHDRPAVGLN
jgi:glycosyltransferase involved in cell wall biosynthesis